ncbi:MAG: hypothetical protein LBT53_07805 [Puniceicoccales bacterium]|jgi:hypothetical protein|nr:hypothetical protein [Puniceicoccales bacterium]
MPAAFLRPLRLLAATALTLPSAAPLPAAFAATAAAFFAATTAPVAVAAPAAAPAPKPRLSERAAEKLEPLKKLLDANDLNGLLALADEILAAAEPASFDQALFSQIRGQILLNLKQYPAAIAPLETALNLGETRAYFGRAEILNLLQTLSQVYYQEAAETKDTAARLRNYSLAIARIRRWTELSLRPTAETRLYTATLLYSAAAAANPEKPDPAKLREALAEADESLLLRRAPHEQTLILAAAVHQQLGDTTAAADTIERLAAINPASALYWQQLFGAYSILANEAKHPRDQKKWRLRMLLTLERAAERGHLGTAADLNNKIALLFVLGQFDRAAALLEDALDTAKLPVTRQNGELLAAAWQRNGATARAVAALRKAVEKLPADGALRLTLARILRDNGDTAAAYAQARQAAATKLDKPAAALLFLAHLAYELRDFAAATAWLDDAAKHPDTDAKYLASLRTAIRDAAPQPTPSTSSSTPSTPPSTPSTSSSTPSTSSSTPSTSPSAPSTPSSTPSTPSSAPSTPSTSSTSSTPSTTSTPASPATPQKTPLKKN